VRDWLDQSISWTISGLVKAGTLYLKHSSCTPIELATPDLDARWLLMWLLEYEQYQLITKGSDVVAPETVQCYKELIIRRASGEPVAYLVGSKVFMGLDFYVEPGVLIPRPDTEVLVEAVIDLIHSPAFMDAHTMLESSAPIRAAEIGTGSGAICVSLLHTMDRLHVTGLEISQKAIEITQKNAYSNHVHERLELRLSDVFSAVKSGELFDIIVSNPPYISKVDMDLLMVDVATYEPHLALYGGEDGLEFYRRITKEAPRYLRNGGYLCFEIGYDQGPAVSELMTRHGFCTINVLKDLAGHDRVVMGLLCG